VLAPPLADLAGVDLAAALPLFSVHESVSLVPYLVNPDQAPKRKTAFTQSMRLAGGMEIELVQTSWQPPEDP
jgi:hypothetical protein